MSENRHDLEKSVPVVLIFFNQQVFHTTPTKKEIGRKIVMSKLATRLNLLIEPMK